MENTEKTQRTNAVGCRETEVDHQESPNLKRKSKCVLILLGLFKAFVVVLLTILLFSLLFVFTWIASVHEAGPVVLLPVAIVMGAGMEIYRWKHMVFAGDRLRISEFKEQEEIQNGEVEDTNDMTIEVNGGSGIELGALKKEKSSIDVLLGTGNESGEFGGVNL